MSLWFAGIPLFFLVIFLVLYKINRVSLVPSFVFTLFIFSSALVLVICLYNNSSIVAGWLIILLIIPFVIVMVFGIYVMIVFLLLNTRIILRKEKRTLAHSLTFILALCLIAYVLVSIFVDISVFPIPVQILIISAYGIVFYYFFHITQYMIATLLCNLSRPRKNQDYIIVHGCGLIDGNVSRLLAGRVDRAIKFYDEQKKINDPPKLIFSGGQGKDEPRSEAEAMMEYAISKGVPESDILLEDKSTTTMQNMLFSKQIMDKDSKGKPYRCIYITSDYHLLRTGIYARKAKLKISGVGSKTAVYYLPNALLREYIAYIVMYWKRNIALVLFVFLCGIGLALFSLKI